MIIYVTGIHTNVGKTHVSATLCYAFGMDYFKLIQVGVDRDSAIIASFSPHTYIFDDGYFLQTATSPHIGKRIENAVYNAMDITIPDSSNLVIEIAGGLFSPICDHYCMIDYMSRFMYPSVLVASCYLGCINHVLLSIDSIKSRGIPLLCVIMVGDIDTEICDFISNYSGVYIVRLDNFDRSSFHDKSMSLKSQLLDIGLFRQ